MFREEECGERGRWERESESREGGRRERMRRSGYGKYDSRIWSAVRASRGRRRVRLRRVFGWLLSFTNHVVCSLATTNGTPTAWRWGCTGLIWHQDGWMCCFFLWCGCGEDAPRRVRSFMARVREGLRWWRFVLVGLGRRGRADALRKRTRALPRRSFVLFSLVVHHWAGCVRGRPRKDRSGVLVGRGRGRGAAGVR